MIQYIARALNVEYVLMGKLINSDTIKSLAFCLNGEIAENVEYPLVDTPCQKVIEEKQCFYTHCPSQEFLYDFYLQEW